MLIRGILSVMTDVPMLCPMHVPQADVMYPLIKDQKLRNILCYCWGDYGLPPDRSSWALHVMVVNHYLSGAAYPTGGAGEIACRIIPTIQRAGGTCYVSAPVKHLELDASGAAVGVVLGRRDTVIRAPVVISSVGARTTFSKLVPEKHRHRVAEPLAALEDRGVVEPSNSHLCLFVALNGTQRELKLPASNFWLADTPDGSVAQRKYEESNGGFDNGFPGVFLSFPSTKDKEWPNRFPGKSTAHIIAPAEHPWFDNWAGTKLKSRGDAYLSLKERLTAELLEHMYTHFPHLKGKVEFTELGTPLSNDHYLGVLHGESYGLAGTPKRFRQAWLKPGTPIPGLYLTGQDVVSMGVMGAATAGLLTAVAVAPRCAWSNLRVLANL